ncbi:uncharacterized protein M6B38_404720 [Iris pallida]|uniref:Uncharacterized protein n=1 Tax=Iris pallida TaxID=29817 RepID=A0AAX6FRL6_IRIPA|nr:uncharacterized protein M6B38_404720 [Iris pallida]
MRILSGIGSRAKRLFLSSAAKDKAKNGENLADELGFKNTPVVADSGFGYMGSDDFGSKEETFFDSRAWLDSDCEDDFYSVNGELTPSRGSTPNHQISAPAIPKWDNSLYLSQFPDSKSEPSPTDRKTRLFDLLQETFQGDHVTDEKTVESNRKLDKFGLKISQPPRSSDGTPYLSETNSEFSSKVTPGRYSNHRKDREGKTKGCCFPSLMPRRSFKDSRKQRLIPAH